VHSPGTNGSGVVNGSSSYINDYTSATKDSGKGAPTLPATRQGIEDAFRSFGQLIVASRRPLPTQNGDGTYNSSKRRTGLREDLKVIKRNGMLAPSVVTRGVWN
jgi:hypothetical protein